MFQNLSQPLYLNKAVLVLDLYAKSMVCGDMSRTYLQNDKIIKLGFDVFEISEHKISQTQLSKKCHSWI